MKKKYLVVIFVAIVIAAGIGYFVWESGRYVAKVGSDKILKHEYVFFLRTQIKATESEAGVTEDQAVEELWGRPVNGEDLVTIVMNQALENAKEFKIQLIEASKEKFRLPENEQNEIRKYLDSLLGDSEYVQFVRNELGLTPRQYRDIFLKSQTIQRFSLDFKQKNRNEVTVTDEGIKAFYEENRENFDVVTVRHILIQANQENLTDEEKKEKKKLAEDILKRIQHGEDMVELVERYSEDPARSENKGVYTFTYHENDVQAFKDWAFHAEMDELGMVESEFGYHIMRIEDKRTFEEKKEFVKNTFKEKKLDEYYNNQVAKWTKDPDYNLVKNESVLYKVTRKNIP